MVSFAADDALPPRGVGGNPPAAFVDIADGFPDAVARAYKAGAAVAFSGLFAGEARRRVSLPSYPFERRSLWVQPR